MESDFIYVMHYFPKTSYPYSTVCTIAPADETRSCVPANSLRKSYVYAQK